MRLYIMTKWASSQKGNAGSHTYINKYNTPHKWIYGQNPHNHFDFW